MSSYTLSLVLISAVLHAGWNVLLKRRADPTASAVLLATYSCGFALVLGLPSVATLASPQVALATIIAGVTAGAALFAIGRAFEGGKLGILYAISRSSSILLLWPTSFLLLGEDVQWVDILGAGCITAGLVFLSWEKSNHSDLKHMGWALLSGLCIVAYNLCYKWALSEGAAPLALLGVSDLFRISIAFALISGGRTSRIKKELNSKHCEIFIMAIMSFSGFGIYLYALQTGGTAHLSTLRNLSIVFAALGSYHIGEKLSKKSLLAVLLAAIGTILIGVLK